MVNETQVYLRNTHPERAMVLPISVKTAVLNCHAMGPKDKCGHGVVGTVTQRQFTKGYQLISVVLEPPRPSG